jgi:hypothetical protein
MLGKALDLNPDRKGRGRETKRRLSFGTWRDGLPPASLTKPMKDAKVRNERRERESFRRVKRRLKKKLKGD